MKTIVDQLAGYAAYHRDRRNVALHLIGVPTIVVAVEILLARPTVGISGISVNGAEIASAIAAIFYLRLDLRLGLAMAALLGLAAWLGAEVARQPQPVWLGAGVGLFAIGWAIQFVGHIYEGRKPAFLDDLIGLLVGPLFVVAEIAFLLGLRGELQTALASHGPTR